MQDFNCLYNLDVNHKHKLLLIFIIKVVYFCTLHNKIISPAHFVVYMLWQPMSTWFSNKNGIFPTDECWLLPTRIQVQVNRASISPLTKPTSDSWKNFSWACFQFCLLPAGHFTVKRHDYILVTWLVEVEPRYKKWVGTLPCWWSS